MNESWRLSEIQQVLFNRPLGVLMDRTGARPVSMWLAWWFLFSAGPASALAQVRATAAGGAEVRPVVVWAPGPLEVIASFDRPVDPALGRWFIGRTIPYFEIPAIVPGPGQAPAPRPAGALRIVAARQLDEGRTLVLATDPHPRVARYFLPVPTAGSRQGSRSREGATLAYDLTGVEVAWSEPDDPAGEPRWSGWWPHIDPGSTRRLVRGSKRHEDGLALLDRPGRLVVSALVRLPPGKVVLRIAASGPIEEATLGDARAEPAGPNPQDQAHAIVLTVESQAAPLFLTVTARTPGNRRGFSLAASYRLANERSEQPIERDRLLVPWAPVMGDAAIAAPMVVPDLSGGDPARGQALFAGDQARCAQCHAFRGQGGKIGPDLTDIARKSRAEIYRDIAAPSAAIDPDYTAYTVATRDGRVVVGVVRAEGADVIRVTDTNAHETIVRRGEIQEIRPSATSIMPPGLASALGAAAVRDLIAFLASPAGSNRR
ncbi:MAG TPA: c-type cytochrome [Isosphaeraceae bacterium]|nr:c-type cytochrome [Isosphaeraceae bacterium]